MAESLFARADCARLPLADDSVDLVFGSPPYEDARTYGIGFALTGDDWVRWAVDCYVECLRVSRGLVAWVVEGRTRNHCYSATPLKLAVAIQELGYTLRKPPVYMRQGKPGMGQQDWLRNDYEFIVCANKSAPLPWADNTACGVKPKRSREVGSHRRKDGTMRTDPFVNLDRSNPGNVIRSLAGGVSHGWRDSHKNEASFPQWLPSFFVRSFCPPGGVVLDPFSGSGTTVAASLSHGRRAVGLDIRASQCTLGETRAMGLTVRERAGGQRLLFSDTTPTPPDEVSPCAN